MNDLVKPFDLKVLKEELKLQGLDLAEDAVESFAKAIFSWVKKGGETTSNAYIKMGIAGLLPLLEKEAFEKIDKIDGKEG